MSYVIGAMVLLHLISCFTSCSPTDCLGSALLSSEEHCSQRLEGDTQCLKKKINKTRLEPSSDNQKPVKRNVCANTS